MTWSSWLNQPTAQIYHVSVDYRVPVLGHRRAAGQRRGRGASRGKFAEHLDARLGADRRRRRKRHDRGRSRCIRAIVFGGTGDALRSRAEHAGRRRHARRRCRRAPRARTGRSRSSSRRPIRTRCITRISTSSRRPTAAQTWTQISPDLTRPDPGVPPNLDAVAATDTDRNGKRGVIYAIAPSPLRAPLDLDRHRRRPDPGHDRRRQDLAERHAAGASRRGAASR